MSVCLSISTQIPAANSANSKLTGNMVAKWQFPVQVKIPKGECGKFNATFTLGQKALTEGTGGRSYQGFSVFAIVNENQEPFSTAVVKWVASSSRLPLNKISEPQRRLLELQAQIENKTVAELEQESVNAWLGSLDPDSGEKSRILQIKFCKNDWQNDDGDYLTGVTKGKQSVMIAIRKYNTAGIQIGEDHILSSITFV